MPRAFVTGGTGFIGHNLILQLLEEGWEVTALHRPTSKIDRLAATGSRLVVGSLSDAEPLISAIPEKCDAVFHVAGNTNMWRGGNAQQTRDNVEGTQNMLAAASERSVGRFIHTSSIAAFGRREGVVTEDSPSSALEDSINYVRTKRLGEIAVEEAVSVGMDAVILNPCHVMGPFDTHNWAQIFTLIDQDELPGVPPGSGNFCHVRAVVAAHIRAFTKGRKGNMYILGGAQTSYLQVTQIAARLLGKDPPRKATAAWVMNALGRAMEMQSRITGKEPSVTPEKAAGLVLHSMASSEKAIAELDFEIVPLEEILEDTYKWLREEGLVDGRG